MSIYTDILREIATGEVVFDDEYNGYLYEINSDIDPYILFLINILTRRTHASTSMLRRLVIMEGKKYLYFSRWYPELLVLQYYLLKIFKDAKPSEELVEVLEHHKNDVGMQILNESSITGIFLRFYTAELLKDVDIRQYGYVYGLLRLYKEADKSIWESIPVRRSFMMEDKAEINKIFSGKVYNRFFSCGVKCRVRT